jgi:hypothetical protein
MHCPIGQSVVEETLGLSARAEVKIKLDLAAQAIFVRILHHKCNAQSLPTPTLSTDHEENGGFTLLTCVLSVPLLSLHSTALPSCISLECLTVCKCLTHLRDAVLAKCKIQSELRFFCQRPIVV